MLGKLRCCWDLGEGRNDPPSLVKLSERFDFLVVGLRKPHAKPDLTLIVLLCFTRISWRRGRFYLEFMELPA